MIIALMRRGFMIANSDLPPEDYIEEMKGMMSSHTDWGRKRFTGFFHGRIFTVTYHSGYEVIYRVTNEKNTTMDFVRKNVTGCEIHYLTTKGQTSIPLILTNFLLFTFLAVLAVVVGGTRTDAFGLGVSVGIVAAILCGLWTAFIEHFTDKGMEGEGILERFTEDPSAPHAD